MRRTKLQLNSHLKNIWIPPPRSGTSTVLTNLLLPFLLSCSLILFPNQLPRLNALVATGTWCLSVFCLTQKKCLISSSGRINSDVSGTGGISGDISGWVICSLSPGALESGSKLHLSGQVLWMISGQSSLCVRGSNISVNENFNWTVAAMATNTF